MITQEDIDLIKKHVNFDKLKGRRILITGGSGFVGHWMQAVPDTLHVTALNHLQYDYGKWDYAQWDSIIHLANVPPNRVIACAQRCGAQILYASSGSVVSDIERGEYTLGKIAAEEALLDSGLNVKIARMFTFCGGYMKNHFAVINMIMDAVSGHAITIRSGSKNVTRSYMYAADMAIWLWNILLNGKKGGVYEIGSTQPVTMMDLAREVQRHFATRPMIEHTPVYLHEARPYYVPSDTARTEKDCGVQEYTPFDEAIRRTVVHYQREMLEAVR